jgi:lysozyme
MNASDKCLEIIRRFEGFRSAPYRCPAGLPTIGFGSTRYANGSRVQMTDPAITVEKANELLRETLKAFEQKVVGMTSGKTSQDEFDALVSFSYNVGSTALANSTLMRKLRAGDRQGAADEFLKWTRAGSTVLPGLVKRREAERALFLGAA